MISRQHQSKGLIVVYDRYNLREGIVEDAEFYGFSPIGFSLGDSFLRAWNQRPENIENCTGLIIHLDLDPPKKCIDVLNEIRMTPEGKRLRTVLATGSVYRQNLSEEIIQIYKPDAYFDPSEGHDYTLPKWLVSFLNLGEVSDREAKEFRGIMAVRDGLSEKNREDWINFQSFRERRK